MKTSLKLAGLAALIALCACGQEPGAGGLTAEEERALDNAASMLDSADNIVIPEDGLVANEAAIAAEENGAEAAAVEGGNGQ